MFSKSKESGIPRRFVNLFSFIFSMVKNLSMTTPTTNGARSSKCKVLDKVDSDYWMLHLFSLWPPGRSAGRPDVLFCGRCLSLSVAALSPRLLRRLSPNCHMFRWHWLVLGLSGIFVPGYPSGIWTGTRVPGVSGSKVTTYPSTTGVVARGKGNCPP